MTALIDLHHQGVAQTIGVYLVETSDGPALIDCGPTRTLGTLEAALGDLGVTLGDLRHLILTHVHLDHAGASGTIARRNPGITVWASPLGMRHLLDPSRLEASARRVFGDRHDELWGAIEAVPSEQLRETGPDVVGLECFPSPGHAKHHVSYLDSEGVLFDGDATGVRVPGHAYVLPSLPPPDIDLDAWAITLSEIERRRPQKLALVHFGIYDDVEYQLAAQREALARTLSWVESGMSAEEFAVKARSELRAAEGEAAATYEVVTTPAFHYLGLTRYLEKKNSEA